MRDLDVRRSLHVVLASEHEGDTDTLVLDELGLGNGRRRIDVAVVNGELTGYEIKSQVDTLERLPGQMGLYNQVFDRMWLVSAPDHVEHALTTVPEWWGLQIASMSDGSVTVTEARTASLNKSQQDPIAVAQLLWRDEALRLLDEFRIGDAKLRRGSKRHMYVALGREVPPETLKDRVRSALKSRENWRR